MPNVKHLLVGAAIVPLLALSAYACSDDNDAESESSASQESIDTLAAEHQMSSMMYSIIMMDGLGLHDMDDGLNETGEIDASYVPKTRTLIRLTSLTDWDTTVADDADALNDASVELLAALEDGDAEAAKPLATEVHDLEHDFSAAVWEILAADLPADAGGVEDHDEGGADETPAAGETEEGDGHGDGDQAEPDATP